MGRQRTKGREEESVREKEIDLARVSVMVRVREGDWD